MRFSFNINGLAASNWQQLLAWGQKVKPTYTLIMDDKNRAKEWQNNIGGVIYRTYDERDNYYHQHVTPLQAAINLENNHSDMKDMWHYYRLNEPGGDWSELQDWLIDFAEAAKARGFKITTCGLAVAKTFLSPAWVQAGNCDKLIHYAHDNQDTFLIDTHEYTTGMAWSGHTPNYPANLFDRQATIDGQVNSKIDWDSYGANWHLGRSGWVTNSRAIELGYEPLPFVMTEAIFDWMPDIFTGDNEYVTIDSEQKHTETELRARYGDDLYNRDIRGVLGHRRFMEWYAMNSHTTVISDDRFADVVMENFDWMQREYPDNCKTIMFFSMNENWRIPEGHDYIPIANALLPKMESLAETIPPPIDPIVMIPRVIRAIDENVNIRTQTNLNGTIVGQVIADWQNALVSDFVWLSDGYYWRKVEIGLTVGYAAFLSQRTDEQLIEIQDDIPIPPNDDIVMSKADFETMANAVDVLQAIITKYDR